MMLLVSILGLLPGRTEDLLDHMVGKWTLRGTIARKATVHQVDAGWVLNKGYVRLHEVSEEKDAEGRPAYEAIVFISWNPKTREYRLLWLDTTENTGLRAEGIGRAQPNGNDIPFLLVEPDSKFHTTMSYDPKSDSWKWLMDNDANGKRTPLARVTLTRNR